MRSCLPAVMCAAVLLPLSSSALAADEGTQISNYVSFGVGTGFMSDTDISASGTSISSQLSNSMDVHAAFGWAFANSTPFSYRAELEFGYQRAELDSAKAGGSKVSVGGDSTSAALSANGYVDWHFAKDWTAYAGLGLGVNQADYTLTTGTNGLNVHGVGYQWQGMLGAGYQVAPHYTLFAEYRYQQSLTDLDGNSSGTAFTVDGAKGHHVGVGVRIDL